MKKYDKTHSIWVERYRPQCIDDLIITEKMREKIKSDMSEGQIPNIAFFSSTPGTGKSSMSKAILQDMDADSIFINASEDNGIDTLRGRIRDFASGISFTGQPKVVVLDESDNLSNSAQDALRGFIESYSKNCRFILTGNTVSKVSEPILSRFMVYDFDDIYVKNQKELIKQIFERCCFILDNEQVAYDKEDLKPAILTMYPAVRDIIMKLQESVCTVDGVKTLQLESSVAEANSIYGNLIAAIKNKESTKFKALVAEIHNPSGFFKHIFKNINKIFHEDSIGTAIIMTHHFMSSNAFPRDPEITINAFCHQLTRSNDLKWL